MGLSISLILGSFFCVNKSQGPVTFRRGNGCTEVCPLWCKQHGCWSTWRGAQGIRWCLGQWSPKNRFFFFLVTDFLFQCPKYPDPSKLAILRTQTLLIQVQNLLEGPVILTVGWIVFFFLSLLLKTAQKWWLDFLLNRQSEFYNLVTYLHRSVKISSTEWMDRFRFILNFWVPMCVLVSDKTYILHLKIKRLHFPRDRWRCLQSCE